MPTDWIIFDPGKLWGASKKNPSSEKALEKTTSPSHFSTMLQEFMNVNAVVLRALDSFGYILNSLASSWIFMSHA